MTHTNVRRAPYRSKRELVSTILLESVGVLLAVDSLGKLTGWDPVNLKTAKIPFDRKKGDALKFVSCEGGIVGATGPGIELLDWDSGQMRRAGKRSTKVVADLGGGVWLLADRDRASLYNVKKKQDMKGFKVSSEIVSLVPLSNGVAVCSRDGKAAVLDPSGPFLGDSFELVSGELGLAFGGNGDTLIGCDEFGSTICLDVLTGKQRWTCELPPGAAAAAYAQGPASFVFGTEDGELRTVDADGAVAASETAAGPVVDIHIAGDKAVVVTGQTIEIRALNDPSLKKSKTVIRRAAGAVFPGDVPKIILRLNRVG